MNRKVLLLLLLQVLLGCMCLKAQERTLKNEPDGFQWVLVEQPLPYGQGKNYGAESMDGKVLFPSKYQSVNYYDGYFVCKNQDGIESLYDRNMNVIIPESRGYGWIQVRVKDKTPHFITGKDFRHQGISDLKGKEILSPDKGYAQIYQNEANGKIYYSVRKGDFEGILDADFRVIVSPDRGYNQIFPHVSDDGTFWYQTIKDDLYGALDQDGNLLVRPIYKGMVFYMQGKFLSTVDGETRVVYDPKEDAKKMSGKTQAPSKSSGTKKQAPAGKSWDDPYDSGLRKCKDNIGYYIKDNPSYFTIFFEAQMGSTKLDGILLFDRDNEGEFIGSMDAMDSQGRVKKKYDLHGMVYMRAMGVFCGDEKNVVNFTKWDITDSDFAEGTFMDMATGVETKITFKVKIPRGVPK